MEEMCQDLVVDSAIHWLTQSWKHVNFIPFGVASHNNWVYRPFSFPFHNTHARWYAKNENSTSFINIRTSLLIRPRSVTSRMTSTRCCEIRVSVMFNNLSKPSHHNRPLSFCYDAHVSQLLNSVSISMHIKMKSLLKSKKWFHHSLVALLVFIRDVV